MGCGSSKYEGKSLQTNLTKVPELKNAGLRSVRDKQDMDENFNLVQPFEKIPFGSSISTGIFCDENSSTEYETDEERKEDGVKETNDESNDESEEDEETEPSCTDLTQNILQGNRMNPTKIPTATHTKIVVEMYKKETVSQAGIVQKWDTYHDAFNSLDGVYDVAFLSDNQVMLSQDKAKKAGLQVYDVNQGVPEFELGEHETNATRGICVVDTNTIAVVDPEIRSVKFLNQDGDTSGNWDEDLFETPACIQTTSDDKYVVSDLTSKEKAFQVMTKQGRPIRSFHMRYFDSPRYFTLDSHDRVIVTEQSSNSIVIFDKHGKQIRNFAKRGKKDGQLSGPCGVVVDHMDNIFVADANNFRIAMFSPDGRFIKNIASQLDYKPRSLAFRDTGHLAVASSNSLHFYEFYETKSFV